MEEVTDDWMKFASLALIFHGEIYTCEVHEYRDDCEECYRKYPTRLKAMSGNETGTRDKEYIIAFQKLITERKAIPDNNLRLQHLGGLRSDYEILRPLLPVSEPCKEEIHRMITQAINKL